MSELDDFNVDIDKTTGASELDDFDLDFDDDTVEEKAAQVEEETETIEDEISFKDNTEEAIDKVPEEINKEVVLEKVSEEQPKQEEHTPKKKHKNLLKLYVIADKVNNSMRDYFMQFGICISSINTVLKYARDELITEYEPYRVVIIESGTGRFTSISARKELIDILGMCDSESKITIFYIDSVLRHELEYADAVDSKHIEWKKYVSTPDVVAHLLKKKNSEEYKQVTKYTPYKFDETKLNFKGNPVNYIGKKSDVEPAIKLNEIRINLAENTTDDGQIPGYVIKV